MKRTSEGYTFVRSGVTVLVFRAPRGNYFGLKGWLLRIGGNVHGGNFRLRRDAVAGVGEFLV